MINLRKRRLSPVFLILSTAFAVGAAFAQPRAPAFGKPGEPINLVVGFQPYYVVTWTAAIARDKGYWRKHLPVGSRVELNVAIRGPVLATAMRDAKLHIGYIGDAAVPLAAAKEPDICLIAIAALSQDQCIVVARRDAPEFTSPRDAIRWLQGKRIAVPAAFLEGRPDIVRGWLAAELEAQRFLADPRNADEAIRIVAAHALGVPEGAPR